LRLQLAAAQAERDEVAQEVLSDQGDLAELEADKKHVNPQVLAAAEAALAAARAHLRQVDDRLGSLMSALFDNHCFLMQPGEILQIRFDNPTGVKNVDPLFAQNVALGKADPTLVLGGTFPSLDA